MTRNHTNSAKVCITTSNISFLHSTRHTHMGSQTLVLLTYIVYPVKSGIITEPCKGDQDGKLILVDGYCRRCGKSEQHCCADDYCGSESLYCNDGECTECGKKGSRLCYKGKACEDGLVPYENDICDCGGKYQNCCDGDCNDNDLVCEGNSGSEFGQCQPCGGMSNHPVHISLLTFLGAFQRTSCS